jgi:prepilin-type N-terminal cleavage/methylation domain-containing protein
VRAQRTATGFTLLEVVIALTILGLITGTLFAIIRGSVKGSVDIEKLQQENDQINRFIDLCRETFLALPAPAALTLTSLDPNNPTGGQQELGIAGMRTCFTFGTRPVSYSETIIGLQPDMRKPTADTGETRYILSITRTDIIPPMNAEGEYRGLQMEQWGMKPDDQERYWHPLLRGVTSLKWRFWKESTDEWLEVWEDTTLPDMVEMQLLMNGRTTPTRMVFAMPTKTLRPGSGNSSSGSTGRAAGPTPGGR